MTFTIKKHIEFFISSIAYVTFGYLGICWLNVVIHNLNTGYVYPEWNIFVTMIRHAESASNHTPAYVIIICILCIIITDLLQILWWKHKHPNCTTVARPKERGKTEWGFFIYHK